MRRFPRGAGALLSVLVVSSVLLLLASLASLRAALLSVTLENTEAYTAARAAAWSCVDMARMRLLLDSQRFENGSARITLPYNALCTIISATTTGTSADIRAEGNVGGSFVRLLVTATRTSVGAPLLIETWREY